MVIKLEVEVVDTLVSDGKDLTEKLSNVNNIVLRYITEIISILNSYEPKSKDELKVHNYYLSVFNTISSKLPLNN